MKVALLVRVSSDSDRQDYTRQISDLTKVAKRNNWEIVATIKAFLNWIIHTKPTASQIA